MDALIDLFATAQEGLFETVFQPLAFAWGLASRLENVYDATGWLLIGLLQIAVMLTVIGPLQRWHPAEVITDTSAVRTDVLYTLIHRLGIFQLVLFFSIDPLMDELMGHLRTAGVGSFHLDDLWPGVTDGPIVSFVLYLVLFDFVNYWMHRAQHEWNWWWALHAVHHSQRQMTQWSDNRNHLIDDLLRAVIWVVVAQLVGIAPSQFVAVVALTQLSENFQHANLRLSFGLIGERFWVSPRFHRLHHAIGLGHESHNAKGQTVLGGHNFGVLLPCWDVLFRTANFDSTFEATGIRDQVTEGRDYGKGFISQQILGIKRLFSALGLSSHT
jgi:sterol desaturase/sphingolipid hydroxylase (fatty acid hydroxylase superfamily)